MGFDCLQMMFTQNWVAPVTGHQNKELVAAMDQLVIVTKGARNSR